METQETFETRKTDPCPPPMNFPVLIATAVGEDRLMYEAWMDARRCVFIKLRKPLEASQEVANSKDVAPVTGEGRVWYGTMHEENGRNMIRTNVPIEKASTYIIWSVEPEQVVNRMLSQRIVGACHKHKQKFFQVGL